MPDYPPEALTAAAKALAAEPGIGDTTAARLYAQKALGAAVPAIVEAERAQADALRLSGTDIEVAVHRVLDELRITRTAPAVRELKDLYRAGVRAGLCIALRGDVPEPEAVQAIRAGERECCAALAESYGAIYPAVTDSSDLVKALAFADLIRQEATDG